MCTTQRAMSYMSGQKNGGKANKDFKIDYAKAKEAFKNAKSTDEAWVAYQAADRAYSNRDAAYAVAEGKQK